MASQPMKGREKILHTAIEEFSTHGYTQGSVNSICKNGNISKGAMYHHFTDKDALYLACLEQCFTELTAFLRRALKEDSIDSLQLYFSSRDEFFKKNPVYQGLFVEATVMPPQNLKEEIAAIQVDFNKLNEATLRQYLKEKPLRQDFSLDKAIELISYFQSPLDVWQKAIYTDEFKTEQYDLLRSQVLDILLYGLIERE